MLTFVPPSKIMSMPFVIVAPKLRLLAAFPRSSFSVASLFRVSFASFFTSSLMLLISVAAILASSKLSLASFASFFSFSGFEELLIISSFALIKEDLQLRTRRDRCPSSC